MKKVLFVLVSIMFVFSSCGGDSALKINETIVAGVDPAVEKMEKVNGYIQDDDYNTAKIYLDSVSAHITKAEAAINALNNKTSVEYKQSALDFLRLISTEGIPAYKKAIELYQTGEDQAQYDEANKLTSDFIDKVQKQQKDLQDIQVKFAEANNVKLY